MNKSASDGSPADRGVAAARRPRGTRRIVLAFALVLAAIALVAALQLAQDRSRMLSLAYARQAKEANDRGDHAKALLWALAGLPQRGELWGPDSSEARFELLRAYSNVQLLHVLRGHSNLVLTAAFSPDGKTVLTASLDKTAKFWDARTGKVLKTLTGHELPVMHSAFDTTGKRVVTASGDMTARVWDVETGRTQIILKGHDGGVLRAGFSPDGARVFTASFDGKVRLWNAETGALIHTLVTHDGESENIYGHTGRLNIVYNAEFSPDGRRLLAGSSDGIARVWNAATGELELRLSGHGSFVEKAIFSPSGDRIATASWDGTARLWDAESGKLLCSFEGHEAYVRDVAINATGNKLVTAAEDRLVRIWDPKSCKLTRTLVGRGAPATHFPVFGPNVAFNPAGTRLLTTSGLDGAAFLWDVDTGTRLASFSGHGAQIIDMAFSPDGEQVVTASGDGAVRLWSAKPVNLFKTLKAPDDSRVEHLVFDWPGKHLATAGLDKIVRLWDARTGKLLHILSGHEDFIRHVAFNPTGERLITCEDKAARVWDTETGELLQTFRKEDGGLFRALLNAEGLRSLTLSRENTVWDVETGRRLHSFTLPGLESSVLDAAFTPDGPRVLTQNNSETTGTLWNVKTGKPVLKLKASSRYSVIGRFDRSGTHLVTSVMSDGGEGTAHIREAGSGKPVMTLHSPAAFFWFLPFDWSERRLLARQGEMEVYVWGLESGRLLQTLSGHTGTLLTAGFAGSPDFVFTASVDGTGRLWDVHTGRELARFSEKLLDVSQAAIDKAGTRIVTAAVDNSIKLWKVPPVLKASPRQQVQMACEFAKWIGVTEFRKSEIQDSLIPEPPPRPCSRSGLLTMRFYEQATQEWFRN